MEPLTAAKIQKILYITYIFTALDITLLFVQFSITPYLARRLGFDTLWFGYLQTTVGVIQLLGGPVFGRFADVFGARTALSISSMASVVYFLLLASADSTILLFLHKLPAVFMHALPGAQMVVADLSASEKRAEALAKLGLCFGIGMITGSSLGGTLSTRYGEKFAAYVAAGGSLINLLLVLKFIPKHTKKHNAKDSNRKEVGSVFSLEEIVRLMKFPGVAKTFTVKIISGLPSGVFQVMFSIIAINFFQLKAEQNGYLMAYIGVVQMVIQGAVIGRLTSKYPENSLLLLSIGLSSFVGLAQALMANVFQFCFVVVPMMFSLSVFNVITDSMLTKSVPASDTGTMLGLCASVQSLLRTIGPTIGGFLYETYGVASFGYIQFTINATVFSLLFMSRRKTPKTNEHC
ncbi:solute carrier family 22 member 18 [Pygocentrus nattereri]|uniref:Organic cation transporter-like protein 2 n=1 Tax=Pygocentrus nattereri TaxID=42514 RepID=A0A3B4D5N2_PYGNA|nr:solute carrier family 22 member 18 [Pygocentrus nattereri]